MSAFITICGARKAFILSDTAHYGTDGIVTALRSKFVQPPGMIAVLTNRGMAGLAEKILAFCSPIPSTFDELCAALPDAAARFSETPFAKKVVARSCGGCWDLAIAGWSESRGRPLAFKMYSPAAIDHCKRMGGDGKDAAPFALVSNGGPVEYGCSSPGRADIPRDYLAWLFMVQKLRIDPADSFHPEAFGVSMFEAIRTVKTKPHDGSAPHTIVGGSLEVAEITRDGVTVRTVHEWPSDVVGDLIEAGDEFSAYDDTVSQLANFAASGLVDTVQEALDTLAEIATAFDVVEEDVASAATCDIGATTSKFVHISGSTGITSFGTGINKLRFVRFTGSPTLTHNATTLVLLGGRSRTIEVNSWGIYRSDASGNWSELHYVRALHNPGPAVAFSAYKAADQTAIATGILTKITFTTEVFDAGGFYDAVNSKWTPPAGKYLVNVSIWYSAGIVDQQRINLQLYKNGVVELQCEVKASGAAAHQIQGTFLVSANGSDFFEVYCLAAGTGDKTVLGSSASTYFQGFEIK